MTGSKQSRGLEPEYCCITGAGSSGLIWADLEAAVDCHVYAAPDETSVPAMAGALESRIREHQRPLVLVGASLGAMVALELARSITVDALVLLATGFGIEVSDSLLSWIAENPADLFTKMARISVMNADDKGTVDLVVRDFKSRGQATLLRQLSALAAYRPTPLRKPPPTLVIWGVSDHSVPLEDHVELALKCRGAVIPMAGAKHMPFFEQPRETAKWMKTAYDLARGTS